MAARKKTGQINGAVKVDTYGVFTVNVDPTTGVRSVIMPTGEKLTFNTIAPLILERLINDDSGKPEIPQTEVRYAGGRRGVEPNPNDPAYIDALNVWARNKQIRMIMGLISLGVQELPPAAFVENMRDLFPFYGNHQLKYLWVGSMLTDESQIGDFAELITGQTLAIEGDISASMDSFRSSD